MTLSGLKLGLKAGLINVATPLTVRILLEQDACKQSAKSMLLNYNQLF